MNKQNALLLLLGTAGFVVLLVLVWGSAGKNKPQPPRPAPGPAPAGGEAKKPVEPAKQDPPQAQPGPAQPGPKPVEPAPPVQPGGGEAPKPVPAGGGAAEEPGASFEKPRITADTGIVEEPARAEAAGSQEVPMPWLKKDKAPEPDADAPKALPKTYTVARTTNLYRVAEIVYGDAKKWTLLYEANKAVLEDPEKVREGTVLTVPDPSAAPAGAAPGERKKSSLTDGLF